VFIVITPPLGMLPSPRRSHRGPATDRPPDKPPPWKGISRGYLLERTGTRHHQLASCSRGSDCSSGNAIPLQKMQFGGCAPSNNSASQAAGTSQESSTSGSRAGRLRGVVGSWLTGYVCGKSPPSSKPGSQSFSPAEVFLPHPSQQVQWHSVTTVTPNRYLACTTP
jgi:hypothetical protein